MNKKSFADQCLEHAVRAVNGPVMSGSGMGYSMPYEVYIAHRDCREAVPELSRRLKRACEVMRAAALYENLSSDYFIAMAKELEAMPEGEK